MWGRWGMVDNGGSWGAEWGPVGDRSRVLHEAAVRGADHEEGVGSGAMFVGVHERQLDDKGRLALPSAFRSMLGDACYLVLGDDGCINVYSAETFEATGADMMARVRNGDVTLTRARALAHSATKVTLDKQGRVTVDDKLRGYARLQPGSKVVVAGASSGPRCGARSATSTSPPRAEASSRAVRDDRCRASFTHRPVMLDEIVGVFAAVPAGVVLDATLGRGGHSEALLDQPCRPVGRRASTATLHALAAATARLERFGDRFRPVHARFDELDQIVTTGQLPRRPQLSGALFDLGVSSPQLDRADRGFSYRQDGPLDMRMDPTAPWSAADVVNGYGVEELDRVIRALRRRALRRAHRQGDRRRPPDRVDGRAGGDRHGGDPRRRPVAPAGTRPSARSRRSASRSTPSSTRCRRRSTRRSRRLAPGGRIAVLSYHSGEDRIAKDRLRQATGACDCPPDLPCVCGAVQTVRLVRGIAKRPSAAERAANPRAASARLRVAERVAPDEARERGR